MYNLSNFSSVFELAVALYLAFPMYYSIKHSYFQNYIDHLNYIRPNQDRIKESDIESFVKAIAIMDRIKIRADLTAKPKIKFSIYCSVFFALSSLTALIYSGFKPDYQLSTLCISTFLGIIVLAAPLMILNLSLTLRTFKNEFQEAQNYLQEVFSEGLKP